MTPKATPLHSAPEFVRLARAAFRRGFVAAGIAASLGAMGCMSVEGEFPEVEMTRHNLRIAGVVTPDPSRTMAHTVTFEHPYTALEVPDEIQSELRPVRCVLTAGDGVEDLGFIEGFTLSISAAESTGLPSEEVFAYERDETEPDGPVVSAEAVNRPNVLGYWETGTTVYTLSVYGRLPPQDWSLDVSVVFAGKAKFEL